MNNINICVMVFALLVCVYIYLNMKEHFADGDKMDISSLAFITQGTTGKKGDTGAAGVRGIDGIKGDKGNKGVNGVIDLSSFTFADRVAPTETTAAVPSKMVLPSTLCIGSECITGSDYDNINKTVGCRLFLWDAPPTYRDFSTINSINPINNPPFSVNPEISWRTLDAYRRNDMVTWGCGMLDGPCQAWYPANNTYANQWQIIYTEPKLSQSVKGIRILSRKDGAGSYNQYVIGVFITYKPLDNNTLDPKLIDKVSGEVAVIPGAEYTTAPDGKSFYFKDTGAWGGIEIHFDKPIKCKYIRMVYTYYNNTPANRTGLYLCI